MNGMQQVIPHLWFDKEAKEAAEFYASLFPDSKVTNVTTLRDTPSGDADVVVAGCRINTAYHGSWYLPILMASRGPR